MNTKSLTIIGLILTAVFSRLIPHPWNLTAVGAVALFSGAYLRPKPLAFLVPLVALLITDLILGFHVTMAFTYAAIALCTALSLVFLKDSQKPLRIGILSLSSSVIFFVVSNLGIWLVSGMYSLDLQGLVTCFVMAWPFFQGHVIGDLLYSAVLFGAYSRIARHAQWVVVKN